MIKNTVVAIVLFITQITFGQEVITRKLGDFDAVKVFDKINIELISSNENRIEISGNENENVEIVNNNGELKIRMPLGKLLKGDDIKALLYFKKIETIEASEGSYVTSKNVFKQTFLTLNSKAGSEIKLSINVKKVTIRSNSGATITVDGNANNQDVIISSGGILNARNLETNQTTISVNAGGNADIRASELVDAKVRAGGSITIYGKPKQINQKTVLGGSISEGN